MDTTTFPNLTVGATITVEDYEAILTVLRSEQSLNRGKSINDFENAFATYINSGNAIATSSCTGALKISYQALGLLSPSKTVIIPINTFWNTVAPLVEANVNIEICDVEKDQLLVNTEQLESICRKKRVDGVVITDFGGHPNNYNELLNLRTKYGFYLITDAAHAVGSSYDSKKVGSLSDVTCFSFSTLKNMVTLGEGGMLTTDDSRIANMALKLRESWSTGAQIEHPSLYEEEFENLRTEEQNKLKFLRPGDSLKYSMPEIHNIGTNYKMTTIQAAVGITQLSRLEHNNELRKNISEYYVKQLQGSGCRVITPIENSKSSWHLFNILLPNRDLKKQLELLEIINRITKQDNVNRYWPVVDFPPIKPLVAKNSPKKYKNYTEIYFGRMVSLPINPKLDVNHCQMISSAVIDKLKQ